MPATNGAFDDPPSSAAPHRRRAVHLLPKAELGWPTCTTRYRHDDTVARRIKESRVAAMPAHGPAQQAPADVQRGLADPCLAQCRHRWLRRQTARHRGEASLGRLLRIQ
jgi:hypothetical protein